MRASQLCLEFSRRIEMINLSSDTTMSKNVFLYIHNDHTCRDNSQRP